MDERQTELLRQLVRLGGGPLVSLADDPQELVDDLVTIIRALYANIEQNNPCNYTTK